MRVLFCVVLLVVVGGAFSLRCFECDDCLDESADSKQCSPQSNVCLKFSMGKRVMKTCATRNLCSLNEFQKTFESYWQQVTRFFGSDSSSEKSEPLLQCCESDYCNSGEKTLASVLVLIPSFISFLGLKYWF